MSKFSAADANAAAQVASEYFPEPIAGYVRESGLKKRAMVGTIWTVAGVGGSNVLRLISNLMLTRLLVPEAFGLMGVVMVFVQGLIMFSDVGLSTAMVQNPRAEEPRFANTAWTVQAIRGGFLTLAAAVLGYPLSLIYNEPIFVWLLPVVGASALIQGFNSVSLSLAKRRLALGRLVVLELGSQLIGIVATVALALTYESVWALAGGALVSSWFKMIFSHIYLAGVPARFCYDRQIAKSLFNFGKYILLSTIAAYLISQGDRVIISGFLSMEMMGVYFIGMFLGTAPIMAYHHVVGSVLMPLFVKGDVLNDPAYRRRIWQARMLISTGFGLMLTVLIAVGPWLVELMYPVEYQHAGAIVVLFAVAIVPQVILQSGVPSILASGDSKGYMWLMIWSSIAKVVCMLVGAYAANGAGLVLSLAVAEILTYPLSVRITRRKGAWMPSHDAIMLGIFAVPAAIGLWWHWKSILVWF